MSHMVLTADDNLDDDRLALLGPNREPVHCRVRDLSVATDLYDHVVTSLADLPPLSGIYYDLTPGSWAFPVPLNIGTNTIRIPAGDVYVNGLGWNNVITATGNYTFRVSGGNLLLKDMSMVAGTACIIVQSGSLYARNAYLAPSGGTGSAVRNSGGLVIDFLGCTFSGGLYGCYVDGNVTQAYRLVDCDVSTGTAGVFHVSGTMPAFQIVGSRLSAITGINWNTASLPTGGLLVNGCHFNCTTNYAGHTPASALANYKCNSKTSGGAGLLTETAIVP